MNSEKLIVLNYTYHLHSARKAINTALAKSQSPVLTTKFTENSAVLLHLVTQIRPDIPVVWVDTGYNTRATLNFTEILCNKLNLSLHRFQPHNHEITIPPALDSPEHADFVQAVKLEPFKRAMAEMQPDTWLSSIRRYQTEYRNGLSVFGSWNSDLIKVSPLLDWSSESMLRYLDEHDLPKGPVCFDPTKGDQHRECGLHLDNFEYENSSMDVKMAS